MSLDATLSYPFPQLKVTVPLHCQVGLHRAGPCFEFPLEMRLAKPAGRRSVQECLSSFWLSTNSCTCWHYLRRRLGLWLHTWLSSLSLQKDCCWIQNIYGKESLPNISWIQTMLWSATILDSRRGVALSWLRAEKLSADQPSSNKIFRFLSSKSPLFLY